MNLNCYNMYPKEERKVIQDFIDDVDFMVSELNNLYRFKVGQYDGDPEMDWTDPEARHITQLYDIIAAGEEIAHDLREYKENI